MWWNTLAEAVRVLCPLTDERAGGRLGVLGVSAYVGRQDFGQRVRARGLGATQDLRDREDLFLDLLVAG